MDEEDVFTGAAWDEYFDRAEPDDCDDKSDDYIVIDGERIYLDDD
jgi:hypothetical protein